MTLRKAVVTKTITKTQPLLKRKKHAKGATYQQRLIEIS